MATKQFPCPGCGAQFEFDPSAGSMTCPYCGYEKAVPKSEEDVKELDFDTYLDEAAGKEETVEATTVKCEACGAESTFSPDVGSEECPFCGTHIVLTKNTKKGLKPKSLLPFKIAREQAYDLYKKWILSLWFAPSALKQKAYMHEALNGMYIPYWTYDANTMSYYTGERGEDYKEIETYTETDENGAEIVKTREVTKTRWHRVSGWVWNDFDDILVLASKSLPKAYADNLEPWDLENLAAYSDEYLSGFRSESYQVSLKDGFDEAKGVMENEIDHTVRRDIGGDHQRVHSVKTQYDDVTFKHILLPIWIAAYLYNEKSYRFLVNARTGEVQGERPYSWIKIALAIFAVLAVIGGVVAALQFAT